MIQRHHTKEKLTVEFGVQFALCRSRDNSPAGGGESMRQHPGSGETSVAATRRAPTDRQRALWLRDEDVDEVALLRS